MPGAYPPGAGYPPPPKKSNRTVLIVVIVVAVLALLCCGGGAVALIVGAQKADEAVSSLPTTLPTGDLDDTPTREPALPGGPTAGPRATADGETRNMAIGDTLVISDDDGTVEITVTKVSTRSKACEEFGLAPDRGTYLLADVTVEVTKGTVSVNPLYFRWVAADGAEISSASGYASFCGESMEAGDVAAGGKRTGTLVFNVADRNGVVEYLHRFRPAGSWRP